MEEVWQRGRALLIKKYIKNRSFQKVVRPKLKKVDSDWWKSPLLSEDNCVEYKYLVNEAENYLLGNYTWLNIPQQESVINWHQDPQTSKSVPLEFGLEIDYRNFSSVGNVKNIWEKSRHHHLTVMSAAYALTKDEKYAIAVSEQLQDWVSKNPFPRGINWTSSLEVGVRLISCVWIDRLLRGSEVHDSLFGSSGSLWTSIYWHQWLIAQYYSHGSSANNHLVGEMAGLFISCSHWEVFPSSKSWKSLSWNILEREISKQTFASGLNREQAFSYHIFSTEFFLLAGIEAEMQNLDVSAQYKDLVSKMLEIIPPLTDCQGNLPSYGDGDEGMALQLRPHKSSRVDWLFRLGRQWLNANVPIKDEQSGYLATRLINLPLPDTVEEITSPQNSLAIPDAGLYILAKNRGTPEEILCLADAGNLGFLSIAAHGHADALSFTLSIGGVPILIDPGTYVYHADDYWHEYFRSTKAHNTLVVDDFDQSQSAGTFLWTKKAKTKVLDWQQTDNKTVLIAEHDGYKRLPQKVIHRRQLTLESEDLEILDHLQGGGAHHIEWRLHFSPLCTISLQAEDCLVTWDSGSAIISLDRQMTWSLLQGDMTGGWYSSGFNLKQPITTLVGKTNITKGIVLKNSFKLSTQNCERNTQPLDSIAI